MDRTGIEKSVICCIATRPEQYEPILRWCGHIRSDRLIPFPSVHPADPAVVDHVRRIGREGFQGVKLHPYYQDFFLDEDRMRDLYEQVDRANLLLVVHTGYDIAFPRIRRADPRQILAVKDRFPTLGLVTTHMGAWQQWEEVQRDLIGHDVLMEISFALDELDIERAREMILGHPPGCVLFGTDSPWTDQADTLALLERLGLPDDKLEAVLATNALTLLGLP
jgi:predicted TIM-barrel fold metal-dependent hydrolase